MKTAIEMFSPISVPAEPARETMIAIMRKIADRQAPYDNVTLTLGLRELHLPVDATISVPIHASVTANPVHWECSLEIAASAHERLFPRFHGTISVSPLGEKHAEVWLWGDYEAPLGGFGHGVDSTLLRGAAENSLRQFVSWLANEIENDVRRTQEAAVRAAMQFRP